MDKPIITRATGGEYSTVALWDGMIETLFFADDGSSRYVNRTVGEQRVDRVERAHRAAIELDRQAALS